MVKQFKQSLILSISLFLAGCSDIKTPAGPTCVSCKPYIVRGKRYYPQSHYEYDEVGLASWYGYEANNTVKATGEKYDRTLMTAAHRTLPLPSVAKVTNLLNGKSIIVVIDDRGPYCYKGRIIDLSYGSAKALGIYSKGLMKVRVQVLPTESLKLSCYIAKHC
ncbi:MAG: septal ring lytic transglycosylase RlpA family protein, partial [Holosporales bacterium]|nr:septal ring lytic transglycosylase RlpA family protein [Holosporales bacterium]